MKKFITTAVILVTLAGCSASVSASAVQEQKSLPVTKEAKEKPKDIFKLKRNLDRMTKLVKYLGTRENRTPYVFSGSSTYGWDCSGMVVWLYEHFGITLPHSADKQAHEGERVSLDEVKVGDIAVYAYNGSTNFYHSSIVYKIKTDKNGKRKIWIINANRATGTTSIQPLSDYKRSQIRFVKIIEQQELAPINPIS
mgnify:CR=1 FL=1